jgi:phosphatidylglycerophosphate synthase
LIVNRAWQAACLLFWLAVLSDFVDGRLARSRGESSAFGGLLDHSSDATFVVLGQMALVPAGQLPVVLPVLVVAAFLQYVFDSRILAGRELRTSFIGRWNGIFYFVPPGVIVTRGWLGFATPPDEWVLLFGWALVISTLISMIDRLVAVVVAARKPN